MAQKADKDHIMLELEPTEKRRRGSRSGKNTELTSDVEPLYETDVVNTTNDRRKPPLAGPEMDDEDDSDPNVPFTPEARPGVDDGFFPVERPRSPRPNDTDNNPNGLDPRRKDTNDPPLTPRRRNFPYAPDFGPGIITINGVPTQVPDFNQYQQKKTLAQGMMDLALLSANANQLRYVLESYKRHPYYFVSLVFISISLIFQIAVGVGLILNSRYNVKDQREICKANRINNFTIIGIFIVTIVNVFISAFGVADPPLDMNA